MTDLKALREAAEKAAKVATGTWERDSERQEDAPNRHDEFALFDGRGYRLLGTENSDYRFGLIEAEYDEDGSTAWNEPSRIVIDYLVASQPATILSLLDRLATAETNAARIRALEGALEPFALMSSEGVVRAEAGHVTVTTCAEYFHRARTTLDGGSHDRKVQQGDA